MGKAFTKLDDRTIERIRLMREAGNTYISISKELGISVGSVSKYAKRSMQSNSVDDRAGMSSGMPVDVDALVAEIELLKQGMRILIERIDNMPSRIVSMIQAQASASTQQPSSPQPMAASMPSMTAANGYDAYATGNGHGYYEPVDQTNELPPWD